MKFAKPHSWIEVSQTSITVIKNDNSYFNNLSGNGEGGV